MAKARFLMQAVTKEDHSSVILEMLNQDLERLMVSVAFAKSQGAAVIKSALEKNKGKCAVFVGIRNDITSYQALEVIFETGADLYVVDTGSRTTIFHPKIYLAETKNSATAIIGSANLTFGGLHNNIEASSILDLDLNLDEDKEFINQTETIFKKLVTNYPEHVIKINSLNDIKNIFESGRVVDENVITKLNIYGPSNNKNDSISLMNLFKKSPQSVNKKKVGTEFNEVLIEKNEQKKITDRPSIAKKNPQDYYLVWESKALKERDLNIPTGGNTNPTGSMLWKKGAMKDIDQRHYFRDEVFAGVDWEADNALSHYERAQVKVHIFTKGEDRGVFELNISHNTNNTSTSYNQKNAMTSVSWGSAKSLIAQTDLLGQIMLLYRKDSSPPEFMIVID